MHIGPHRLPNPVILAPMAGVTDRPFRSLCRRLGAGLAVSEMVSADTALWGSRKSLRRLDHAGEPMPKSVQIAGSEPGQMAEAARLNVERGAQLIDINMGCPAKKVCNRAAGSALLQDEELVAQILAAVVAAVPVPVTLKIRTGWDPAHRNGVTIACIAEAAGIAALAVHGRTRACGYSGSAEYDTIARIKAAVSIPVIANGDIQSPADALRVRALTGADGIMIGRGAQGRPWLLGQVAAALEGEPVPADPDPAARLAIIREHLDGLYAFYGGDQGVRIARKHVAWYAKGMRDAQAFRERFNACDSVAGQGRAVAAYFAGAGTEPAAEPV